MSFSFGFTGSFMLVLCTICIVQCLNDRSRDKRNANIQKAFEGKNCITLHFVAKIIIKKNTHT